MTGSITLELDEKYVSRLRVRAASHGVSAETEAANLVAAIIDLERESASEPSRPATMGDDECDWLFDRHDLRHGQPSLPPGQDFKTHLLCLGEFGADIEFEFPRDAADNRPLVQ